MQKKTISEINETYELDIDKIVKTIRKEKAKKVLLQFPEGMKPYAQVIVDELEEKTGSEFYIWLGTCFGACDLPIETERLGIDLIVQFGHSKWNYSEEKNIQEL